MFLKSSRLKVMAGLSWLTGLGLMLALISCTTTKNVPAATVTATSLPSLKTFATNTATPIPTSAVEKFDSNPDDLVSEENLCPASIPFDKKLISSGSILARDIQSKTDQGYVLIDPRTGQVDHPANWEWTRNSTGSFDISPDKNSILLSYTYSIPDKAESMQDWLVYGNNLELIARRTFEGFDRNRYWLDNQQIIYFDGHGEGGPPAQDYIVWDPASNQEVKHKFIINFFDTPIRDDPYGFVDFDPSLTFASYLTADNRQLEVMNLKTKKKIWTDKNDQYSFLQSLDGQNMFQLSTQDDRFILDHLSTDGSLRNWVNIKQVKDSSDTSKPNSTISWSPDSRYLLMSDIQGKLMMLDIQNKVLLHTCLDFASTWSPDSRQVWMKDSILDIPSMQLIKNDNIPLKNYDLIDWVNLAVHNSSEGTTANKKPTPTTFDPTSTPEIMRTPEPLAAAPRVSPKDGMKQVFVPAGPFQMGSEAGHEDAQPAHTVDLDAYWIDQTKVTNAMYSLCVRSGGCTPPGSPGSKNREYYYNSNSNYSASFGF